MPCVTRGLDPQVGFVRLAHEFFRQSDPLDRAVCGTHNEWMGFGRMIRVSSRRGDPSATTYVVAEPDAAKAIDILKAVIVGSVDEYEDLGRVTDQLLRVLNLAPGQFIRS
jgi:hypothetical protein